MKTYRVPGHPSTTATRRGAAVYGITVKRLLERGSDNNYYNLLEDHLGSVKTQVCRNFCGGKAFSTL